MLAFAPPLSHNQSTEGPSSASTVVRSRSTSRPSIHASSSAPTASTSTSHSNTYHAINRTSAKHSSKSLLVPACSSTGEYRSEPSSLRNTGLHLSEHPPPLPQPQLSSPSEFRPPHSETLTPPLKGIHEQDPNKLLQLLASLLQQIASANDHIRSPTPSSPITSGSTSPGPESTVASPPSTHYSPIWSTLTSASRQAFSTPSASLTFHARNIPTITLEAYLLRILKYCPTTNEVFLSLLVYFDRMSKLAYDATGKGFAIDSYNVHRLIIAGVTVASKFFSDVFYTNSRYAKVGGLPQSELNQLELQFLLLNNFRLSIATEEMQRYAEQLQIYSQNSQSGSEGASSIPVRPQLSPLSHTNPKDLIATSMRRMGAADAYGGRLPGAGMTEAETIQETYGGVVGYHKATELERKVMEDQARHGDTLQRHSREFSAESGAETEEEGVETDDEPTIRGHSSAGSETQSLCTVESEDTYSEREEDESESRTPERGATMSP